MKTLRLTIIAFLLFGIHSAFGQTSWTYRVKFDLYDKEGALISPSDFKAGKAALYTMPEGAHTESVLKHDTVQDSFIFSQHTIASRSMLVFVAPPDTAVFVISTLPEKTAMFKFKLINGTFARHPVRAEWGSFENETTILSEHPDFSFLRKSFYDRVSGAFRKMKFSDLKKVESE